MIGFLHTFDFGIGLSSSSHLVAFAYPIPTTLAVSLGLLRMLDEFPGLISESFLSIYKYSERNHY